MQEIMSNNDLTNIGVAKGSGIHKDTISQLRRFPDKTIRMDVLEKLCNYFNADPSYFFKKIEIGK